MVMYDNEFKTKENKILTKIKTEPQFQYGEEGGGGGLGIRIMCCHKKNQIGTFFWITLTNFSK